MSRSRRVGCGSKCASYCGNFRRWVHRVGRESALVLNGLDAPQLGCEEKRGQR